MSTPEAAATQAATIKPHTGKLGIMIPGMGAVATTLIAGVEAIRRGMAKPIGSLTQMGHIRLGKRTDANSPLIKDFFDIAPLEDLVFTGWDIFGGNLYDAAKTAEVLDRETLEAIRPFLESIEPMPAVFDQHYVKRLTAKKVKVGKNKCDLANQIRNDIAEFKTKTDRQVMIWCGSTEIFMEQTAVHQSLAAFEKGLVDDDPGITPSMMYAWAALKEGIPFANGAPNLTVDIPALNELSRQMNAPICGKDFKTGQTSSRQCSRPPSRLACWA
jgi:myo-inositol-1-phosphate synthase